MKTRTIKIKTKSGVVTGLLDHPSKVLGAITLAHGAGAGMHHAFMGDLAAALASQGLAVLRFQFPFAEAGRKRVDPPLVATATIAAAVVKLAALVPDVPVFAAGKSFGARMTTTAAADGLLDGVDGLICFGFPLHPAGQPGVVRARHLAKVPVKMLFLQGTRDSLADLRRMKRVCARLLRARLKVIDGADHSFGVLKRSGRLPEDVFAELAEEAVGFVNRCHD